MATRDLCTFPPVGTAATKVSVSVGRLLRRKRHEFDLSLRDVSLRLAEMGGAIPVSTLARIEQGKLDPGVVRLHQLLRLYKVPAHLVADLTELEEMAVEPPEQRDMSTLYKEGVELWRKGELARGLAYLLAVRQYVPDDGPSRLLRQKAILAFATSARNMGKTRLAKQVLEELLLEPPEKEILVGALALSSTLWQTIGSLTVARALVDHAESLLEPGQDEQRAWVLHQKSRVLAAAGSIEDASRYLERSIEAYRAVADTHGETRALLSRIDVAERQGRADEALRRARAARGFAEKHAHSGLAALAQIEIGRLLSLSGDPGRALEALQAGLSEAVRIDDSHAEFTARYHLWKTHVRLGDRTRARFELDAARYFLRLVDDDSPEALDVRRQV
jgi:tetratricopeptide (TPR) repeat protein